MIEKIILFVIALFIGFIAGDIYFTIYASNEIAEIYQEECYKEIDDLLDRDSMYNPKIGINARATGVYHYGKFFCVWTENRTSLAINHTIDHEYLHHLIATQKEHFCGNETK